MCFIQEQASSSPQTHQQRNRVFEEALRGGRFKVEVDADRAEGRHKLCPTEAESIEQKVVEGLQEDRGVVFWFDLWPLVSSDSRPHAEGPNKQN